MITRYVVLSFFDDKVINSGTWRSTGQNDFSGGDNEVNNRTPGLVHTGGSAGTSDTTEFIALTRFINSQRPGRLPPHGAGLGQSLGQLPLQRGPDGALGRCGYQRQLIGRASATRDIP